MVAQDAHQGFSGAQIEARVRYREENPDGVRWSAHDRGSTAAHEFIRWSAYTSNQGKRYFFLQVVGGKVHMS
jgi:hypothetical protein